MIPRSRMHVDHVLETFALQVFHRLRPERRAAVADGRPAAAGRDDLAPDFGGKMRIDLPVLAVVPGDVDGTDRMADEVILECGGSR